MENTVNKVNVFTFLSKLEDEVYFCRSFFPRGKIDYSIGQTAWTLLYKKKIHSRDDSAARYFYGALFTIVRMFN